MFLEEAAEAMDRAGAEAFISIMFPSTRPPSTNAQPSNSGTSATGTSGASADPTECFERFMTAAIAHKRAAHFTISTEIKTHLRRFMSGSDDPCLPAVWMLQDGQIFRLPSAAARDPPGSADDNTPGSQEEDIQVWSVPAAAKPQLQQRKDRIVTGMSVLEQSCLELDLENDEKVAKVKLEVKTGGDGQSYLVWTVRQ